MEEPMTRTVRREILQPASALVILSADWLVWLVGGYFGLEPASAAVLGGATVAGLSVWLIEGLTTDPLRAFARGLSTVAIVWVPGLVAGTVVGLLVLAWWLALRAVERRHGQS
jgi:hypothetical protein